MNLTEQIIEKAIQYREMKIVDEVYRRAKFCLLDYCGVVLAGSKLNRKHSDEYLKNSDAGNYIVFNSEMTTDIFSAAFLNGWSAHITELDDGHRFGMIHPGSPVITPLLLIANKKNISGEHILRSIVFGYEVACGLAVYLQPEHKIRGYHSTGTCGMIGAAAALAFLTGQNENQLRTTLTAAATGASGLLAAGDEGSELKPYNVGKAAAGAILAMRTGFSGYRAPDDPISGKKGFLSVVSPNFELTNKKILFAHDGFEIMRIYFKPYSSCRHCHSATEAALKICDEAGRNFSESEIEKITVNIYESAINGHNHTDIPNVSSAKMSIPYSTAVAILYGLYDLKAYEENIFSQPDLHRLAKKVEVVHCSEFDSSYPEKRTAAVKIFLKSGKIFCRQVDIPKGEPENPLTEIELEKKFRKLSRFGGKSEVAIEKIVEVVKNLESEFDELFELLKRERKI